MTTTSLVNEAYMLFENEVSATSGLNSVENYHQADANVDDLITKSSDRNDEIATVIDESVKRIRQILEQRQEENSLPTENESPRTDTDPPASAITVHVAKRRKIPRWMSENIFIITLAWQLTCVGSLELVDMFTHDQINRKEKKFFIVGIVLLVILQLVNMAACLSVTIKLFKQYRHQNTSMKFLFHCYISILFLFGGIYTLIAWISPHMFTNVRDLSKSSVRTLDLYSQLLFMSISTGTLCGATTISASHVLTESIMSLQMLLSFLYFTSILSEVVNPSMQTPAQNEVTVSPKKDDRYKESNRNIEEDRLSERC